MAQGGGQAGGMGASPMGGGMGGQMQGLGSAPMGGGFNGFGGGQGPYSPGMQMPMNSTNTTTQQNIMGAPMQGQGMGGMGGTRMFGGPEYERYRPQPPGGMAGPGEVMFGGPEYERYRPQPPGGMGQPFGPQVNIQREPRYAPDSSGMGGMNIGGPGGGQNIMELLRSLGIQMPSGVPQMQTPFTQQGQPQVTQAATAQPQPPATPQPQMLTSFLPQPSATPQPVAAQPPTTDQRAAGRGVRRLAQQARQQRRPAGFQMASGGIASLRRR